MSIALQNFVQIVQGARVKPLQPVVTGGYTLMETDGFAVNLSNIQILIVVSTIVLMVIFSALIAKTPLGPRAARLRAGPKPWRRCPASMSTAPFP